MGLNLILFVSGIFRLVYSVNCPSYVEEFCNFPGCDVNLQLHGICGTLVNYKILEGDYNTDYKYTSIIHDGDLQGNCYPGESYEDHNPSWTDCGNFSINDNGNYVTVQIVPTTHVSYCGNLYNETTYVVGVRATYLDTYYIVQGSFNSQCKDTDDDTCTARAVAVGDVRPVQCCADTDPGDWIRSRSKTCNLYTKSTFPKCYRSTWGEAVQICKVHGGRLCTREELEYPYGCAMQGYCGYDWELVWSSTPGYEDGWFLGDPGTSCTDVCSEIGGYCNAAEMSLIDNDEKLLAAAADAGVKCEKLADDTHPITPFFLANWNGYAQCEHLRNNAKSTCEARTDADHQRFCYCGNFFTEPPPVYEDGWFLGDQGANCTHVCSELGGYCNATKMTLIDNDAKLLNAAESAGVQCDRVLDDMHPVTPFYVASVGVWTNTCEHLRNNQKSTCEASHESRQRFCYCENFVTDEYYIVSGKGNFETRAALKWERWKVLCCADENPSTWVRNEGCSVFVGSHVPNCVSLVYESAIEYCKRAGSRLCTRDELESGCGNNSGCGFNQQMVWSSTAVP